MPKVKVLSDWLNIIYSQRVKWFMLVTELSERPKQTHFSATVINMVQDTHRAYLSPMSLYNLKWIKPKPKNKSTEVMLASNIRF